MHWDGAVSLDVTSMGNLSSVPRMFKSTGGYKWRAKMIFVRPGRKKWAGGVVPLPEIMVDRVVPL